MREFISREFCQAETRLRFERYSRRLVFLLAAIALLILLFVPTRVGLRESALDTLERMAVLTAFLAFAWYRARSGSTEIHRELEQYLKDMEG